MKEEGEAGPEVKNAKDELLLLPVLPLVPHTFVSGVDASASCGSFCRGEIESVAPG